jgi:hypothetical protein
MWEWTSDAREGAPGLPTYAYCGCCVDDAVVWCLLTPSLTQTLPALLTLVLICSSMERRESRAYASRAERAWVSSGVNKHRTRPRHLHAPCSPASITPASPVPNAIWAAFHPVFGNHVNETTAVGAHSSLSAFRPAHRANEHQCNGVPPAHPSHSHSGSDHHHPPPPYNVT